ncbi:MAG TPA: hypothetical protein VF598_09010 [Hymenobacter sp.]|jgi:uncharacterized protein with FMN-binding domain
MNPENSARRKQLITALAVLLAIVIIVGATVVANNNKQDNGASTSNTSNTTSQTSDSTSGTSGGDTNAAADATSTYKDGTYTADANYQSPGGAEDITVKLTLAGGTVTASEVTTSPSEREAEEYQSMFKQNYKEQVVGKSIDSINLSRVSGSSLTSGGFNDAVDKIKQQAKS